MLVAEVQGGLKSNKVIEVSKLGPCIFYSYLLQSPYVKLESEAILSQVAGCKYPLLRNSS